MSPEYGATCGFFPVDQVTLEYLRLTGRPAERIALVEAYCKENLSGTTPTTSRPTRRSWSSISRTSSPVSPARGDRRTVCRSPTRSGRSWPRSRPSASTTETSTMQQSPSRSPRATRPPTARRATAGRRSRADRSAGDILAEREAVPVELDGERFDLEHGAVVIAAITSCTNTSNPSVMIAAGLVAKKAVERGLSGKPWVKSSLAPGSKVVTEYYERAGLTPTWRSSASTRSAARPASGTRARCPSRSRRRSRTASSSSAPCCREPELRGAHPSRGEGELPRLSPARRGVRAGRADGHRSHDRAARPGQRRRGRTSPTSGPAPRRSRRP